MEWMPGDKLTASLFLGKASRHVMGSTRVPTTNLPIQRGPGGEEPPPRALSAAKCRPRPGRSEQRPRGAAFICSPLPHTLPPPPPSTPSCLFTAPRSWSLPSEPPRFIRAAFPHPHASSGSPGEAGGGCACSEWWQRRGGGEAVIARRCRAGCPIVGKWLHVQQRILCPCCSSVIDLTSSRGVENFKGGSGCWRSGQERRRLVVRRSASSPSPPPSGAGVKRVGVRGRALRSPQCTQSIN